MYERQLPPRRPNRTKVKVRNLGTRGVPETNHTSFRLSPKHREKLRKLAAKKYGGITMSACLRILVDDECKREGIE